MDKSPFHLPVIKRASPAAVMPGFMPGIHI
jgi:hypothetical protein